MKKFAKKLSAITAMMLAVVMFVTACGNGAGGDSNLAQGVTDDEILIGNVFVVSGPFAFVGIPIVESIRAVIERQNAHGGVAGRQINLISHDDGGDPTQGHLLIERLLEEDRVFAMVGLSGAQAPMSLDYMLDFGVPIVNITGGLGLLYSEYNPGGRMFNVQPSNRIDGPILLARALATQVYGPNRDQYLPDDARIGVMLNATDAGFELAESIETLAREIGVYDRLMIEFVTADIYFTVIQQMMTSGVEVLINGTMDGMGIVAAMYDAGWYIPVFSVYGQSTVTSFSPVTYHPQRPLFATIWAEDTSPEALAMLADMRDTFNYLPHIPAHEADGFIDNGFARAGYMMGMVLVEGLRRFDELDLELTWENFVVAMESDIFDLGGFPNFGFADGRRMGVEDLALWEYWVYPNGEVGFGVIDDFMSVDEILAPWRARTGN
ncbi:MAG: ABC transporter substrate-binding protein [Defluviitaleaceae bacterium]|nr:ABC transporter substrate-binding protein [Defluviitaleaceae bacterium]